MNLGEGLGDGINPRRLLQVDNRLVLPVGVPVRLLITSSDVLHSFAVPSLGIKVDAVPGRLSSFMLFLDRPGLFFGQCSEICGPMHGFMPIVIEAVSVDNFIEYVVSKEEPYDEICARYIEVISRDDLQRTTDYTVSDILQLSMEISESNKVEEKEVSIDSMLENLEYKLEDIDDDSSEVLNEDIFESIDSVDKHS
jgi:hypothetical protein